MRSTHMLQGTQVVIGFHPAADLAGLGQDISAGRLVSSEQSNSSVVFGEQLILKVFRRLEPGINPELEVLHFLAQHGCRPIVLERGTKVSDRIRDVERFDSGGPFHPESNYLFGEGGAGTFSDGKLTCRGTGPDVMHVLEGSATVVTGGTMLDPREVAPGELRASGAAGGERHELGEGDVLAIPNGVPHQFVEVSDPFLYFVVKVEA